MVFGLERLPLNPKPRGLVVFGFTERQRERERETERERESLEDHRFFVCNAGA